MTGVSAKHLQVYRDQEFSCIFREAIQDYLIIRGLNQEMLCGIHGY